MLEFGGKRQEEAGPLRMEPGAPWSAARDRRRPWGRKWWVPWNPGLWGLAKRGRNGAGRHRGPAAGLAGRGLLGVPATWAPSCSGLYDWWQLVLVWIVWTVGMAASQALSPQPRKGRVLVAGGWAERLGCGVGAGRSASCRGPGLAGASRTGRRQMGAQGEA